VVTKYAVYRSNDGEPYFLRAYTEEEEYFDESDLCEFSDIICFHVSAIYNSDIDSCESIPSNESCEICPGFIENELTGKILIYPNPASDLIYIESEQNIENLTIFDSRGITIEQWNSGTMEPGDGGQVVGWSGGQVVGWSGGQVVVPVDGLPPGLYLVRVETAGGVMAKKVVVGR
jgi:hypothetical protein